MNNLPNDMSFITLAMGGISAVQDHFGEHMHMKDLSHPFKIPRPKMQHQSHLLHFAETPPPSASIARVGPPPIPQTKRGRHIHRPAKREREIEGEATPDQVDGQRGDGLRLRRAARAVCPAEGALALPTRAPALPPGTVPPSYPPSLPRYCLVVRNPPLQICTWRRRARFVAQHVLRPGRSRRREDHRPRSGVWKGTSGGEAISFSGCDDNQTSADTSVNLFKRHLALSKLLNVGRPPPMGVS